jgi:hypothetical protein
MPRLASSLSVLVLATATVALAACGGSSGGSSGANSSAQSGTTQNASRAKFDQCLKDQGVTPPTRPQGGGGNGYGPGGGNGQPPAGGPGGGGDPKLGQAMQACAKYRPQGAGGGRPGGGQQNIQAFTPYLTCLKDQGLAVKVTDGFNALRNLKRDDPKVQAALKACQSKLPQRPQGAPNGNAAPSTTTAQS